MSQKSTDSATTKLCTKCGGNGPFRKDVRGRNGFSTICKPCIHLHEKTRYERDKTIPENIAKRTWFNMLRRCRNRGGKSPAYSRVECRIIKSVFIEWYVLEHSKWIANNIDCYPSLDRINPHGHYEIGNIRIRDRWENAKDTRNNRTDNSPFGMSWCSKCNKYLPVYRFSKNRKTRRGRCGMCKDHWNTYQRDRRRKRLESTGVPK